MGKQPGSSVQGMSVPRRLSDPGFRHEVVGLNTDGRSLPEFDRTYGPDHLNEVIAESDFIILTLPLTEQTEGMLDREQFERMKAGAYLINISRGALINEEVMLEYLRKKKIAGAALDVFVDEFRYGYLPEESPFWNLDNVIITPHCAGGGDGFAERFSSVFLQNLRLFVAGHTDRMLNVREFGKGYWRHIDRGGLSMNWWHKNNLRLIQNNLREIDANLDVDLLIRELKTYDANVLMMNAGGIIAFYPTQLEYHYRTPLKKRICCRGSGQSASKRNEVYRPF